MISTPHRQTAIALINDAVTAGARQAKACAELKISDRTLRRWTKDGQMHADQRPLVLRSEPANKLSAEERAAYHGDEPILDPVVGLHADAVLAAEALVFVYPTWWSGLPAILKGWLDRVLVPGVGFRFDEKGKVRPGLGQVRHLVGISTYGSPRWYVRLVNDNGRRTITRALRLSCGFRVRSHWHGLYAIDTSTAAERAEFAARVESRMADLR